VTARPPNWRIIATSDSASRPGISTVHAFSTAGIGAPPMVYTTLPTRW
jgi:hypothetical protein